MFDLNWRWVEKKKKKKGQKKKENLLGGAGWLSILIMYVADFSSFSRPGVFVWDRCMIGGFQVIFCYLLPPLSPPSFTMTCGGEGEGEGR